MAFSPGNYVDQRPDGTFGVVIGGVFHGPFATQQEAEQFFNTAQAQQGANDAAAGVQPSVPGTGTPQVTAPTGGSGGQTYPTRNGPKTIEQMTAELRQAGFGGPWDSSTVMSTYNRTAGGAAGAGRGVGGSAGDDVAGFIDANLKSNRERFDYDKTRDARNLYSNVAQTLLGTASQLRGPRDWMSYVQNAAGGRNLTQQLFGSEGVPAFGSPTNPNAAITMDDLLRDLGLGGGGQAGTPGQAAPATPAISVEQMTRELQVANYPGPWDEASVRRVWEQTSGRSSGGQPGTPGQPAPQTFSLDEMTNRLREAGYDGPWDEPSVRAAWQRTYKPPAQAATPVYAIPKTPGGQPAATPAQAIPQVPMAHQVNPAVWDTMSPVAQALALGLAERGQTSAGAYDAEDYVRQMNATRPVGASQRSPRVAYAMPRGVR